MHVTEKLERPSSFYLEHAVDMQLRSMGPGGYAAYFEKSTPADVPFERRQQLCQNSCSVNAKKTFYMLRKKEAFCGLLSHAAQQKAERACRGPFKCHYMLCQQMVEMMLDGLRKRSRPAAAGPPIAMARAGRRSSA